MTDRWLELERVFQVAHDLPAEDREAYLDAECAHDAQLRADVRRLLDAGANAADVIQGVVAREVGAIADSVSAPFEGRRLGAYRVVRMLDSGGMGTVYVAARDDDAYQKRVAIKLLPLDIETPGFAARLKQERQILARLEHPYVVRLLDGGTSDEGAPYLVMELVDGQPITIWCDARNCGIRERVQLFLKVCEAVEFAHRSLIVHRDIKPSNVLVTADGTPKLLDFGIAKLLVEAGEETGGIRTTTLVMTPQYASPEQLLGEPMTTATDVYSLGALLYELLAGRRPHQPATGLDLIRAVCEVEPPAASTVAPAGARAAIRGDLDNILLKALRKNPAARYGSVEQFSNDLRRHLNGRPVLARGNGLGYRAGRYLRRHRYAVAGSSAVFVTIVLAAVVSLQQARRANEQAARAEARFQQIRSVASSFLFDLDEKIRTLPGSTEARELVVARALQYLDGLSREVADDHTLRREVALAYKKVGDIQGSPLMANLGRFDDALVSYRRGLELLRRDEAGQTDIATRSALIELYFDVGMQQQFLGRRREGRAALADGVRLAEQLRRDDRAAADRLLTLGYGRLSQVNLSLGDIEGGYDAAKSCLLAAARWAAADQSPRVQYELAIAKQVYATVLGLRGDPHGALAWIREALAIHEQLAQRNPNDVTYAREIAFTSWRAGDFAWQEAAGALATDDAASAERWQRRAVAMFERVAAADPRNARAPSELGIALASLGAVLAASDPPQALDTLRRAFSTLEPLHDPVSRWYVPEVLRATARAMLARRQPIEALAVLERASKLAADAAAGSDDEDWFERRVQVDRDRAIVLWQLTRSQEAQSLLEDLVRRCHARANVTASLTVRAVLADLYLDLGRLQASVLPATPHMSCRSYRSSLDLWQSWPFPASQAIEQRRQRAQALSAACP